LSRWWFCVLVCVVRKSALKRVISPEWWWGKIGERFEGYEEIERNAKRWKHF
jgi:hypothetical protein